MDGFNKNETKDGFKWNKNVKHEIKNYDSWIAFYNANEGKLQELYGAQNKTSDREESFKKNIIAPFFIGEFFMVDMKNILVFVRKELGLSFKLSTDSDILDKCMCSVTGLDYVSNLLECLSEENLSKNVTVGEHVAILKRAFAKIQNDYIDPKKTANEWSSIIKCLAISGAKEGVCDDDVNGFDLVKAIFTKIKLVKSERLESGGYLNVIDDSLLPFMKLLRVNRLTLRQQHVTMIVEQIDKMSTMDSLINLLDEFRKDGLKLKSQDFKKILDNMDQSYKDPHASLLTLDNKSLIGFLKLLYNLGVKFGKDSDAGAIILKCCLHWSQTISGDSAFEILSLLCNLSLESGLDYKNVDRIVKGIKDLKTVDSVIGFMTKLQSISIQLDLKCIGSLISYVDKLTIGSAMGFLGSLEKFNENLDMECVQRLLDRIDTESQEKSDSKIQFIKLCQECKLKLTKDQFKNMLSTIINTKEQIDPGVKLLDLASQLVFSLSSDALRIILKSIKIKFEENKENPVDSVIKLLDLLKPFKSNLPIDDFKLAFDSIKKINNVTKSDQIVTLFDKLYTLTEGNNESPYNNVNNLTTVLNKIESKIETDGVPKLLEFFYTKSQSNFNNIEFIRAILNKIETDGVSKLLDFFYEKSQSNFSNIEFIKAILNKYEGKENAEQDKEKEFDLYVDLITKMVSSKCDKKICRDVVKLIYDKMKGGKAIIEASDVYFFKKFKTISGEELDWDKMFLEFLENDLKYISNEQRNIRLLINLLSSLANFGLTWSEDWFKEILQPIEFDKESIGLLAQLPSLLSKIINNEDSESIDVCFKMVFNKIDVMSAKYDLNTIEQISQFVDEFKKVGATTEKVVSNDFFIDLINKSDPKTEDGKIQKIITFGKFGLHDQGYQYAKVITCRTNTTLSNDIEFWAKVIGAMASSKYDSKILYSIISSVCLESIGYLEDTDEGTKGIMEFLDKLAKIDDLQLNNEIVKFIMGMDIEKIKIEKKGKKVKREPRLTLIYCLKLFNNFKNWDENVSKTVLEIIKTRTLAYSDVRQLALVLKDKDIKLSKEDVKNILKSCEKQIYYSEIFELQSLLENNSSDVKILNLDGGLDLFLGCINKYCSDSGLDNLEKILKLILDEKSKGSELMKKHIGNIINQLSFSNAVELDDEKLYKIFDLLFENLGEDALEFISAVFKKVGVKHTKSLVGLEKLLTKYGEKNYLKLDLVDFLFEKHLEITYYNAIFEDCKDNQGKLNKITNLLNQSYKKKSLSLKQVCACVKAYGCRKEKGEFTGEFTDGIVEKIFDILKKIEPDKRKNEGSEKPPMYEITTCILKSQFNDKQCSINTITNTIQKVVQFIKQDENNSYNGVGVGVFDPIIISDIFKLILNKDNESVPQITKLFNDVSTYMYSGIPDCHVIGNKDNTGFVSLIKDSSQDIKTMQNFHEAIAKGKLNCVWAWQDLSVLILSKIKIDNNTSIGDLIKFIDQLEKVNSDALQSHGDDWDKDHYKNGWALNRSSCQSIFNMIINKKRKLSMNDIQRLVDKFSSDKYLDENIQDEEKLQCGDFQIILRGLDDSTQNESDISNIVSKLTNSEIELNDDFADCIYNKLSDDDKTNVVKKLRLILALRINNEKLKFGDKFLGEYELDPVVTNLKKYKLNTVVTKVKTKTNESDEISTDKTIHKKTGIDNISEYNNAVINDAVINGVMMLLRHKFDKLNVSEVDKEKEEWITIFDTMSGRELQQGAVDRIKKEINNVCDVTDFFDVFKTVASIVATVLTLGGLAFAFEDIKRRFLHPVNTGVFYRLKARKDSLISSFKDACKNAGCVPKDEIKNNHSEKIL